MSQSLYWKAALFFEKNSAFLMTLSIAVIALVGCSFGNQKYSIDDQYNLARSRIDNMKEQLSFSFSLEKSTMHPGEKIFFTVLFTNKTNIPITLRIPQQSGLLDINHPNTTLEYSIIPTDKSISLRTSISTLGTVYIFSNPVQSSEFVILEPYASMDVKLELPNTVYLKQGGMWMESILPPGQYLIHLIYKNLYIGYQIEKKGQTYFIDQSTWVGQIDAEPVLLTVLP